MFTIKQTFRGTSYPVQQFSVNDLYRPYTFADVTIQATDSKDTLDLEGVTATCSFNGDPFPLAGADYLVAVTGTLSVLVADHLSMGIYFFPFNGVHDLEPLLGIAPCSQMLAGIPSEMAIAMRPGLRVQSFTFPGVDLYQVTA